jgi:hypothetical protein
MPAVARARALFTLWPHRTVLAGSESRSLPQFAVQHLRAPARAVIGPLQDPGEREAAESGTDDRDVSGHYCCLPPAKAQHAVTPPTVIGRLTALPR